MCKLLLLIICLALTAPAEQKPNILFIAIDDLNDWIGPLGGNSQAITPNFDRLAKMGLTFTNAHTSSSACHPSRVANMTGVRPFRSGITKNDFRYRGVEKKPIWRDNFVLKDAVTLSEYFRDKGYRSIGGGKIYHSLQWGEGTMTDKSAWDSYFPSFKQSIPTWPRPDRAVYKNKKWTKGRPLGNKYGLFGWEPLKVSDEETSDHKVVDWAISEMNKKQDKALFLACGLFRPHIPWEVPQKYFDMYPLESVKLPIDDSEDLKDAWDHGRRNWHQWVLDNKQWQRAVRGYLASISYADAQLGRLLDAYEASGRNKDTILVLWSDHGMHIGEKQNWEKFTCWEESTRIPLFVVAPGITKGGEVCSVPVTALDIYPTLVELSGNSVSEQPLKTQLDGESLLPLLKDVNAKRIQPAITSYENGHTVRTRNWRYIYYPEAGHMEELYKHTNDQAERNNLAYDPAYFDQLVKMRTEMKKWINIKIPQGSPSVPKGYNLKDGKRIEKVNFTIIK
ncbi:MAG: sulfatase [Lentisphaeraceae bacterium]|nr:sulfatase [Lentisphaeraceae bacterium]